MSERYVLDITCEAHEVNTQQYILQWLEENTTSYQFIPLDRDKRSIYEGPFQDGFSNWSAPFMQRYARIVLKNTAEAIQFKLTFHTKILEIIDESGNLH